MKLDFSRENMNRRFIKTSRRRTSPNHNQVLAPVAVAEAVAVEYKAEVAVAVAHNMAEAAAEAAPNNSTLEAAAVVVAQGKYTRLKLPAFLHPTRQLKQCDLYKLQSRNDRKHQSTKEQESLGPQTFDAL